VPDLITPNKKVAVIGQKITFQCMSENPTAWFYEKMEILSNVWEGTEQSHKISIDEVGVEHAGYYYCYGKNDTSKKPFLTSALLTLRGRFSIMKIQLSFLLIKTGTTCN